MKRKFLLRLMMFSLLPAGAQTVFTPVMSDKLLVRYESATSLRCDSIVAKDYDGKPVDKIINRYHTDGNLTNKTRYLWSDIAGVWTSDSRYDYLYDTDRNVISSVFATWDTSQNNWRNSEKIECTYDNNHKILSQDAFKWENEGWVAASKGRATYDANGYLASEYSMIYDPAAQKWLALTKNEYTSDETGQWLLAVSYMGKENSDEFVPSFRTHYEYFSQGKMMLRYMQDWDPAQNNWTDTSKETWTYDQAGNEINSLSQFKDFDTGLLKETSKQEKQYDSRGNMLLSQFYNKDTENNWVLFKKETYAYNDRDSVSEKVSYNRDFISGELVASMRNTSVYDERANRISSVSYYWTGNGWENSAKEEMTFNEADQMLSKRKYFWTPDSSLEGGVWSENFKEDQIYDLNGYQTSYVSYSYDRMANAWTGQIKSESAYDDSGNILEETAYQWIEELQDFKKTNSIVYYYSVPSSIATLNDTVIKVFVHDRTVEICGVDEAQVCLFDLSGKLVSEGNKTIYVAREGVYFVVLDGKQTFKIIVK